MRFGVTLAAGLIFSAPFTALKAQGPQAQSLPSPQAVCAFITGEMKSTLPQEPTLCSGKQGGSAAYYYFDIVSPKNVLEGDMRRAWSSAIFKTLEELVDEKSLNGACSSTSICFVNISDAYMTQHNWYYQTSISKDSIDLIRGMSDVSHGQLSERWYLNWWRSLFTFKESDIPGSKENATQLAQAACGHYTAALNRKQSNVSSQRQEDRLVKEGGTVVGKVDHPVDFALPSCSVLLATDKTIYIAVDFSDLLAPALVSNTSELLPTIGEMFDNTGYDGQVIFRTPWTDTDQGPVRVYWTFPIRGIEFAFEERQSGLRDELDAQELLRSNFLESGQVSRYRLLYDTKDKFVLRNAAVFSSTVGPNGGVTVDTTDGAEWKASRDAFDHCKLGLGSDVQISTELLSVNTVSFDGPPILTAHNGGTQCTVPAVFLKGW
jgi:hypothetical protein